jgi:Skp family chaperone for outer membrane proteins
MQSTLSTSRVLTIALGLFCICTASRAEDAFQTIGGPSATRVAVIDLDRAARDLGWMDDMRKEMEECGNQLQADMKKFTGMYNDQLRSIAHSEGVDGAQTPTTAPADLTRDAAAARQQLTQLHQKADQLYAGYRASLVARYREALAPIIQKVAHDRKISLVLVRNDSVLLAEPDIDITSAVIEIARANRPQVAAVPLPRLEGPAEVTLPASATAPTTKP